MKVLTPRKVNTDAVNAAEGLAAVEYDPTNPIPTPRALEAEAIITQTEHADAILELIAALPRLRIVQTLSAGTDRWVGRLPEGVQLSNARGAHGRATAELCVTMLLAFYREVREFAEDQAGHDWATRVTDSLDGKAVLVLGAGDLGTHVAAMLEPFGARPTLVGRTARDGVVALADVPALLPTTDAVVCVLPHTADTHHLIDAGFLGALPDGAIVINAGRGPIVHTAALLAELERRRLRAGLDVTDPEPLPEDHPLWSAPNVILMPHVGGDTLGNEERSAQVAAAQLAQFAAGRAPDNLVPAS